jgi:hypothetical protein
MPQNSSANAGLHYLWTAPFWAGTILALLATKVDIWVLPAVGIVATVMFSQYFGWIIAKNKFKAMHWINERYDSPDIIKQCFAT